MARFVDRGTQEPESVVDRWVEDSLGDGWRVWFGLQWTGVDHIISELRVFYRPAITDSLEVPVFQVPAEGLTARRLRGIRFEAARRLAREALEEAIASHYDADGLRRYLEEARLARTTALRPERRGRWTDADYVALAARYVGKVRDGSRAPVADLAAEMNYSPARIRQALKRARDRGWLTKTVRRRAGGTLTDEALAIARREKEES